MSDVIEFANPKEFKQMDVRTYDERRCRCHRPSYGCMVVTIVVLTLALAGLFVTTVVLGKDLNEAATTLLNIRHSNTPQPE